MTRKKAKWVDGVCSGCGIEKPICNVIRGCEVLYRYEGEMNYCPNCGAKMEVEK